MQDLMMHVHKFQDGAIEYMHGTYLLAKLFSHSLKDEALKWYYQLSKSSIDKIEDLIHIFLHTYGYKTFEKVCLKDLCKIK